jgi:hypothetical protein
MQVIIACGLLFDRVVQMVDRFCSIDIQANRHAVDEQPGDVFRVGRSDGRPATVRPKTTSGLRPRHSTESPAT